MNVTKSDPYEVAPGLWVGSKEGDLQRERQKLISKWVEGNQESKNRIIEITNELIEIRMSKWRKR
jgi:hypothetical protein